MKELTLKLLKKKQEFEGKRRTGQRIKYPEKEERERDGVFLIILNSESFFCFCLVRREKVV